jgi:hypothetical protein
MDQKSQNSILHIVYVRCHHKSQKSIIHGSIIQKRPYNLRLTLLYYDEFEKFINMIYKIRE